MFSNMFPYSAVEETGKNMLKEKSFRSKKIIYQPPDYPSHFTSSSSYLLRYELSIK
jgi:hypothetical protein